ncbi:MAG: hypothetical protein A2Z25_09445 [Planctomycetes bacterium RBG_16_55_9]|nr:MAG: hypothetical protein A2Z25_09445 [Planctomycetes bacterium RBG_16_55_9]
MVQQLPINRQTLKWARETANVSVEEVAFKMKKATSVVEDWENEGGKSPTYIQLETLAYEVYKRPIGIFFFPDPPKEVDLKGSFRTLPTRDVDALPAAFRKLFRDAQAMQINLEELSGGVNPAQEKIFRDLSFSARDDAQKVATAVREYLGIPLEAQLEWRNVTTALNEWRRAIESKGIFVFKDAFHLDDISGFCIYDVEFPVIYLNISMPFTRQVFTLFHELAHLLLKTSGIDKSNDMLPRKLSGEKRRLEVLCTTFTGVFLAPDMDFEVALKETTLDDEGIRKLAYRYKVSREVVLRKCLKRRLVTRAYYEQKSEQWTEEALKRKKQAGGNYYCKVVACLGKAYLDLAFKKYRQGRFDETQLAGYLGVKATSIAGVESAYLGRT